MILKIPKISFSTIVALVPILYFNSCTAEFVKHYSLVLPFVLACVGFWVLLMFREKKLSDSNKLRALLPLGAYALFLMVLSLLGKQRTVPVLTSNLSNVLFMLVLSCIFLAYADEESRGDRRFIIGVWLTDTVISSLYSVYRLAEDPTLSRILSTGSFHQTAAAAAARGVMSFAGVYALVMVLLLWMFVLLDKKKGRMVYVVSFAAFAAMVVMSQFTIALLMLVIGLSTVIFTNGASTENILRRLVMLIVVILVLVTGFPIAADFIFENRIFGYEVSHRVHEIRIFLSGNDILGTDMLVRFNQYALSFNAFFHTYGVGRFYFGGVRVGTHSELLDGFANYGVFYIVFLFGFYTLYRYAQARIANVKACNIYRLILVMYAVIGILNTASWAPMALAFLVIIPFVCMEQFAKTSPVDLLAQDDADDFVQSEENQPAQGDADQSVQCSDTLLADAEEDACESSVDQPWQFFQYR